MECEAKPLDELTPWKPEIPPNLPDCLRVVRNSHRTELVSWLLEKLCFAVPPEHLPLAMVAPA
jgi:hypothetical protein